MGNTLANNNGSKTKLGRPSVNDVSLEDRAKNLGLPLPGDCVVRIASRLPVRDILNFCVTTSYVLQVIQNSTTLWNFMLQRDFTQQMQLDENVLTMETNYDAFTECQEKCLSRVLAVLQAAEKEIVGDTNITPIDVEQFRAFFPPVYGQVPALNLIEAACRDPRTHIDERALGYLLDGGLPQTLQDLMRRLEFETYHAQGVISAKSFSNSLTVSKRNTAKDVSDPLKKYIRIWVLVHSSALYAGWEQNTKKGLHEAEVYIMSNKHLFRGHQKQKSLLETRALIRSPFIIPVLLMGLPGAGVNSFIEYVKSQQGRDAEMAETAAKMRARRGSVTGACCSILVDPSHVISFTEIPYSDIEENKLSTLKEDCHHFFRSTEGNGTLGILVDGTKPEEQTFAFLDKLFETMTNVNVFQYKLAVTLLVHKADQDNVLPLSVFQKYLKTKVKVHKLNFVILYTSIYISGTIDVATKWLMEYGPKYDSSYLQAQVCTLF